jgi:hypothetical protein
MSTVKYMNPTMNRLSINIPNKIKQPAQCCVNCGKSYVKRVNLNKHLAICDLIQRSRDRARNIEEDVEEDIPSPAKMFQMLIELSQKYTRLEEKVDEVNKWVVKKKKKINVLEWLNSNVTPNIVFGEIEERVVVLETDIKLILEQNFYDILNEVFSRSIYNLDNGENPMFAFVQKPNVFYIYNNNKEWVDLPKEMLIKFLNRVHMKVIKVFFEWKRQRTADINSDDSFATLCDKTLVKLMSIEFTSDATLSRIKSAMYAKMKTDMKALIEYEFEF